MQPNTPAGVRRALAQYGKDFVGVPSAEMDCAHGITGEFGETSLQNQPGLRSIPLFQVPPPAQASCSTRRGRLPWRHPQAASTPSSGLTHADTGKGMIDRMHGA